MSEAWQCIELGPGQDRPSFDAWPAPQLPADHLRRHVDTLSRRSTPAALPRVFATLSAAADMMPVHARLAAGQLCDRAMASRQATPMAEHCGAVHPRGMDAPPFAHPEHMMAELHDSFDLRATRPFVACHDTRGRRPSRWHESRGRTSLGNILNYMIIAGKRVASITSITTHKT